MTWRRVSIPNIDTEYEYAGRRVRTIDIEEFIMHGGMATVNQLPTEYEVWDDEPVVMEPPC